MRPTNFLDRVADFISALLSRRPSQQRVIVFDEDRNKRSEFVPNPVTFSELNEHFGEGNWALPAD